MLTLIVAISDNNYYQYSLIVAIRDSFQSDIYNIH